MRDRWGVIDADLAGQLKRRGKAVGKAMQVRDALIVEAVEAGGSLREVGAAVGMSAPGVLRIVRRERSVSAANAD